MMYLRGHPRDYDAWAEAGCQGWSFRDVLPFFKKAEDNLELERVGTTYHAKGGPLPVTRFSHLPPFANDILDAAKELGYAVNDDLNGVSPVGFAVTQTTSRYAARVTLNYSRYEI